MYVFSHFGVAVPLIPSMQSPRFPLTGIFAGWCRRFSSSLSAPKVSLGNLAPAPGSHKRRKRKGRGIGAHGHLCGRGANGQNSRSGGGVKPGFEGGQTPFYLRVPKVGFTNPASKSFVELNLDRLQHLVDTGRLDPSRPITLKSFMGAGINDIEDGVKILGGGKEHLRTALEIHATRFTKSAIEAIQAAGGRAVAVYHSQEALRQLRNPVRFAWKHPDLAALSFAPPNTLRERLYYSQAKHCGYLASKVAQSHSEEFKNRYQLVDPLLPTCTNKIDTKDKA